jgi:hypothetical protein
MSNNISDSDLRDDDILGSEELLSNGSSQPYRVVDLFSTTSANRNVVIATPTILDRLNNVDGSLQVGDIVRIPSGPAAGTYTIELIVDPTSTFRVFESIPSSTGGIANLYHPPGASKIGIDTTNLLHSSGQTIQEVIEDLDAAIDGYSPAPSNVGQVLFSIDGITFEAVQPITSNQGWLVNEQGILIIHPRDND